MNRPASPPPHHRSRSGFTLVELLVVLLIVGIIAAVALPVVIPAISHRQVSESARIVQGGLIAARDSALRSNTPHGIRFLPDSTYNGIDPGSPGAINRFRTLASNRFIPIEQPPGYREGAVVLSFRQGWLGAFPAMAAGWPWVTPPSPDGTVPGVSSYDVYQAGNVLMIAQGVFKRASASVYLYENPTSWYWNLRRGDKIQVDNTGPFFTVVGPMDVPNPEGFINMDPGNGPSFSTPDGTSTFKPEILFVVNGVDDDKDGYIDNGVDGVDNNLDGVIDDLGEWSEPEYWPAGFMSDSTGLPVEKGVFGHLHDGGVSYTVIRRPVPSPGARETVLPSNVVVDLTTAFLTRERSRLPVDPYSGTVDILLDSTGKVVPATQYSSPSSYGMAASFYHIWLAERSDLAEVVVDTTTTPPSAVPLVSGYPFLLPMPVGQNAGTNPSAYDALMASNPTLPSLKGEMRLLTLFTRTGNLITTDRPLFNVSNVNQPYHAPQLGEQGDAP